RCPLRARSRPGSDSRGDCPPYETTVTARRKWCSDPCRPGPRKSTISIQAEDAAVVATDTRALASRGLRQSLDPAADPWCGRRRHDGPDVAVRRLVEIDDHRRVIARPLALASLAIDPGRPHTVRDPGRREHEVDPHPEVL